MADHIGGSGRRAWPVIATQRGDSADRRGKTTSPAETRRKAGYAARAVLGAQAALRCWPS